MTRDPDLEHRLAEIGVMVEFELGSMMICLRDLRANLVRRRAMPGTHGPKKPPKTRKPPKGRKSGY